jgi:hypothetical protein
MTAFSHHITQANQHQFGAAGRRGVIIDEQYFHVVQGVATNNTVSACGCEYNQYMRSDPARAQLQA